MSEQQQWYIVQNSAGNCQILSYAANSTPSDATKYWGPFDSEQEAVVRRIGLIRTGKCQPV
ncbi:hypothetical protein [Gloeocapsa sp. PCC 73106]|uniref:hypothetical protein n=1 Tax=Gloeocapsa sp. PCC 73106 TaxID=102232 RepID=UPI000558E4E3|nr:hypothetical protein [Gloeocapsa sp. PCC 73106]